MARSTFAALLLFSSLSFSQNSKPTDPPQTPRQALLEVIIAKNYSIALQRHLPEATKKYWSGHSKDITWALGPAVLETGSRDIGVAMGTSQPNPNFETFAAGPILARVTDPRTEAVDEVRIDNEDFSNDEDTMQLSFNVNEQYAEHAVPGHPPSLRISMKLEGGVWRFEEIDVTSKLPLGDPTYVMESVRADAEAAQFFAVLALHDVVEAETEYLQRNGGKAFTCSETELIPANDRSGPATSTDPFDYLKERSYKIQLSDCNATGYHAAAVPQQSGQPFFCADQSGAIKKSSSKSAADCFVSGQAVREDNADQSSPQ